jgi:hypothetical protein
VAVELLMATLARRSRAPLALLAATCACAPGDFDELSSRSHGAQPAECGEAEQGEPCETQPAPDAEVDPEADGEAQPEPEPDEAEPDACTDCEGDAAPELDAEACASCVQPADAGMCIDDAGAMCRPDAAACATRVCEPGERQMEPRMCGACNTGKQTRTRSCASDGCSWGPWGAWSACGGVTAACTPKQTTSCANGDDCGHRVCTDSCTWGACQPIVAGGCLRIGEGHTDQGSNYRCCNGGKHWQFCLPDCRWSTDCSPCTEGAPNFCSDCY